MLIGIDASRANRSQKTGVEWYAFHRIEALKKLTAGGPHQWVLYSREALTGPLAELPDNWYEVRAGWPPKWLWTQVRMSWEMWRRPPDVFFVPAHVLPFIYPERSVVTMHDIGFHRMPHLYTNADRAYHERMTQRVVKGTARAITVSLFSGHEIADAYRMDARRIAVTPNGIDHTLYRPPTDAAALVDVRRRLKLPQTYFVVVGRLEAKKNTVNMIKAFTQFKQRRGVGDPIHLVFVGVPGSGYEAVKKAIAASPYKEMIHEMGYIEEADKPLVLAAAVGLVHVSWYEGFGIPVVEAAAVGCPVIAADNSALPEVLGQGNALFVHPHDPDAIARAMDRLTHDTDLRASLREKGIAHAAQYTWEATARATLPVLTEWIG